MTTTWGHLRAPHGQTEPILLIDIGGSKLEMAVARDSGIAERKRVETMRDVQSARHLVDLIVDMSLGLGWNPRPAGVIVAAVPGWIDRDEQRVIHSANVPLVDFPLAEELQRRLGAARVILEDDANCGVLGEHARGAARGHRDVAYLSLSTGVGMGAIVGGRLMRGATRRAGEVGHMTVVPDGRQCGCGRRGCLEAYFSGRALAQAAAQAASAGGAPGLASLDPSVITGRDVVEAAYAGDGDCQEMIHDALTHLAVGVQAICAVFDPALVVFGGGLMKNAAFAADVLQVAGTCDRSRDPSSFVGAELGGDAVLAGALVLAERNRSTKETEQCRDIS
ncbi:MAG: hypothetical protein BGO26_11205 [Actinobacteria bacterium 69-20]|jgi:glucokinase|nr:ROK family protein [Actinomycetota bacterium]OJV26337.1 MAG: hypothetical protein BGO26_11205 [Actinobacteria bacterium 69-20]